MPSKAKEAPELTERQKLIEQLKRQVQDAEERGQFDTCHHAMLAQTEAAEKELENA
jgi:hypothetical protein